MQQDRRLRCSVDLSDLRNLPKRFVEVGSTGSEVVKICETQQILNQHPSQIKYLTLSHRWGDQKPLQLLHQNYGSLTQGIELSTLPKTFRDAVEVTRKLKVSYIWIDSLCIVQDSVEDWAAESAQMHHVYRNSYINLCAAGSTDSAGGLFYERNPLSSVPCVIELGPDKEDCLVSTYRAKVNNETPEILTRGWVFQEVALAPRILYFGKQELYWECNELQGSETFPEGKGALEDTQESFDMEPSLHQRLTALYGQENDVLLDSWGSLLGDYSATMLTRFSDKLDALAGLAGEFSQIWGTSSEYLAGLWGYRLRDSLLWECRTPRLPQRLLPVTAPSWSWASTDGHCSYISSGYYLQSEGLTEVLSAEAHVKNASSPYGQVTGGCIRVDGPLVEVILSRGANGRGSWSAKFTDNGLKVDINDLPLEAVFTSKIVKDCPIKIPLEVTWDDRMMRDMVRSAVVYLAPMRVTLKQDGLGLEGLLLTPSYLKPDEYRRVGCFGVTDRWVNLDLSAAYSTALGASKSSGMTEGTDSNEGDDVETRDSDEQESMDSEVDDAETLDPSGRHIPFVEMVALFQSLDQQFEKLKDNHRFKIMKERMQNLSRPSTPSSSAAISSRNDHTKTGILTELFHIGMQMS